MTEPSRPLIVGNWKMNGTRAQARTLVGALLAALPAGAARAETAICPPFTLLAEMAGLLAGSPIGLGAQDCHERASGAFTGSIAAPMLADLGCRYVLVGHSERRHGLGEDDAAVAGKVAAAWAAGLTPILCLGETAFQRTAGLALAEVATQLAGSLPAGGRPLVLAYEPVWAIGTGQVATLADIAAMHAHLRQLLTLSRPDGAAIRILYGGSVKPDNAGAILAVPDVGGLLVGGASLDAGQFAAIARAAG